MRILGLDPGLARVGYGVIEVAADANGGPSRGQQRMLDCGLIRTSPEQAEGQRLVEIAADLRVLLPTGRPARAGG